jgi:TetR/AcrR family transcriptional regulator, transcriptional repressor for nem operon
VNAKTERRDRSHETILVSAMRLVREKGIAGARVADVMAGAGLTVGGFYAHFESKKTLVDEALQRTAAELRDILFSRLDDKPEADRAEVVLKRYLSARHRDDLEHGCALPAVVGEVGTTAGEHAEVVSEQIDAFARRLEEHLPPEAHRAAGAIPARQVALGLVALMYGGLSLARAARGTKLSDEIIRACRALGRRAARVDLTEEETKS